MKPILVVTTLDSAERARELGRWLVEQHLAACAQITAIESIYPWKGSIEQGPEWRLLLKTTTACVDKLTAAIAERHPYELPAIHAVAMSHIHVPYEEWIDGWCRH